MKSISAIRAAILVAATGLALLAPAHAQTGTAFYAGKAVTYIVATAPGGGYDAYGRLVSEYMQKYQRRLHNFGRCDEWNLCLTARTVVRANQEPE